MQESASFWTDIKNLEERLAKSPDSFCFAQLADVYLKVGLVDDAIHVARQGVVKHPGYLSGQRVLSLSCHAKGLNDEALAALKLVVKAMPEDIASQKLFGRLLVDAGNQKAAVQAFRTALEFAPDDVECRIELESLERSEGFAISNVWSDEDDDEEIIEDLEIVEEYEECEELENEQPESEAVFQDTFAESVGSSAMHHDPLSTGTLAELYVTQGFVQKALEIYRAILTDNPADRVTAARVAALEMLEIGQSGLDAGEPEDASEEEIVSEPVFMTPAETLLQEDTLIAPTEHSVLPVLESKQSDVYISGAESGSFSLPLQGVADNALSTFNGWLENIRRFKSCR